MEDNIHWLNFFTPKGYISQAIGPAGMILGKYKPDYSNLKLEFGKYFQVYEETRKGMTHRSVGGIALITKNYRGLYYVISLKTRIITHKREWTALYFTKLVIFREEQLAADEGIDEILHGENIFEW